MIALLLSALLSTSAPSSSSEKQEKPALLVLDPVGEPDEEALRKQVAVVVSGVAARGDRARVYSAADVAQLAALAVDQQLTGCSSEACLAEVGDALGARYVVFGTVRTVAGQRRLELRLFDVTDSNIVARADTAARDKAALLDATPALAEELFADVFPKTPLLERAVVVGGVVTAGVGAVVGVVGGAGVAVFDAAARDAGSSGADKDAALVYGPVALVVAGAGAAVVVVGAAVFVAGALAE